MNILKIILTGVLLLCLLKMPYGYYQFVRLGSVVGFAVLAYDAFINKQIVFVIAFVALAILFQPFAKIIIQRDTWKIIDVIVAMFLIVSIFITPRRLNG